MAVALRERFEAVADAYERSRPGYPARPANRDLDLGLLEGFLLLCAVRTRRERRE